ncbi:MAG: hypothetical protein M3237_02390, partial [Actinomycetota bacterium]|nr:hypothetical protein [Actinomycetota bacterium]
RRQDDAQRAELTPPIIAGRAVGIVLLLLAVAAGRVGVNDELENLAPALVVGAAWPLLFLAAALVGPVWRWVDPWDSLARMLGPGRSPSLDGATPPSVWPAVVVVLPWLWYLAVYRDTLEPRSVGLALALYTVLTLAGCLALGRTRWLRSAEPLGILLGWVGLLPRRRLRQWQPPRGAEVLLGVVAGGLLFGAYRRTELWGPWNTVPHAELAALAGLAGSCALGAGLLLAMRGATLRGGDPAAVARAAVPTVAAIVVAVAMERNRLTTSVQLLPGLLGDPLGYGWDPFGLATAGLDPAPFGTAGLIVLQLAVLLAGVLAGVVAAAGTTPRVAHLPVALSSAFLADAAALAIAAH